MSRLELKSLETQLKRAKVEHDDLRLQQSDLSKRLSLAAEKVNSIATKIEQLKGSGDPIVTEHALLRFIERTGMVNIKQVESKILNSDIRNQISTLGDGKYPLDGLKVVVKNNAVVTVED